MWYNLILVNTYISQMIGHTLRFPVALGQLDNAVFLFQQRLVFPKWNIPKTANMTLLEYPCEYAILFEAKENENAVKQDETRKTEELFSKRSPGLATELVHWGNKL